ncbi:MAG: four helix bundle protein [Bacteroidota bacterium]
MRTHKDLDAWKISMTLVKEVYLLTSGFPKEEMYGLTSQIRRSAVSVPSNIAEGAARNSLKEFIQFLYIALGSLAELETQLIIANDLNYTSNQDILEKIDTTGKIVSGLIRHLKAKI